MLVTEQSLQLLKRDVESLKNKKVSAQATLAEIERSIANKKEELAKDGIHSVDDLNKMKSDIDSRYTELKETVDKYRSNVQ